MIHPVDRTERHAREPHRDPPSRGVDLDVRAVDQFESLRRAFGELPRGRARGVTERATEGSSELPEQRLPRRREGDAAAVVVFGHHERRLEVRRVGKRRRFALWHVQPNPRTLGRDVPRVADEFQFGDERPTGVVDRVVDPLGHVDGQEALGREKARENGRKQADASDDEKHFTNTREERCTPDRDDSDGGETDRCPAVFDAFRTLVFAPEPPVLRAELLDSLGRHGHLVSLGHRLVEADVRLCVRLLRPTAYDLSLALAHVWPPPPPVASAGVSSSLRATASPVTAPSSSSSLTSPSEASSYRCSP